VRLGALTFVVGFYLRLLTAWKLNFLVNELAVAVPTRVFYDPIFYRVEPFSVQLLKRNQSSQTI
jgi:hypothetical protein